MATPSQAKKHHILIVDDEKTAHQLYKLMLKSQGYRLSHAENGSEAVKVYRQNPDIDLILMDIKMPVMNGYEAAREIRSISKEVIIIAQTAYSLPADKQKAFDSGCNNHLSKPVDRNILLKKIQHYLGEQKKSTKNA